MLTCPSDYVSLDSQRFLVHRDYHADFVARGWLCARDLIEATESMELMRERAYKGGWDNLKTKFASHDDGTAPLEGFVKRHQPLANGTSGAVEEAEAIFRFQDANLTSMKVIAVGTTAQPVQLSNGRKFSSVFLSEGLTSTGNIYDQIERFKANQDPQNETKINDLIRSVAQLIGKMHAADLYHGDCNFSHVLEVPTPLTSSSQLSLIDLQGARELTGIQAIYALLKDMGQLRASLIRAGVYRSHSKLWYSTYFSFSDSNNRPSISHSVLRRMIEFRSDLRMSRRLFRQLTKLQWNDSAKLLRSRFSA